jgi:hypothetical protein
MTPLNYPGFSCSRAYANATPTFCTLNAQINQGILAVNPTWHRQEFLSQLLTTSAMRLEQCGDYTIGVNISHNPFVGD